MAAIGWSPEEDKKLAQLWEENKMSVLDMAPQFSGRSRNSLIGRAHRLGLPPKQFGSGPRGPTGPRGPRSPRGAIAGNIARRISQAGRGERREFVLNEAPRKRLKVEPVPAPPSITTGDGVPLGQLKSHHCRDVIGYRQLDHNRTTAIYCGAPKHGNASFCEYHCAMYYKPVRSYVR